MRQDLKHSVEKRQQYSKNTYGPNKSSLQRQNIRQPTQPTTAKLLQEEQQPGTQTKELR